MHRLEQITFKNFRSCRDCRFPLSDFTPMVGYNNGGKSNILEGIRWLLEGFSLDESQFNDSNSKVVVEGQVTGIEDELLARLADKHRKRIEPYCVDGILRLRRTQPHPSRYKKHVKLEVWHPEEEDNEGWKINPTGIGAAISALFPEPIEIGAMEDATEDVGKHKTTTTIGKLIAELTEPIEQEHGDSIREAFAEIEKILEADGEDRAPKLNRFDDQASKIVQEFFPGIRIAVHVPAPEIKQLFKSGTIKVFERDGDVARDVNDMGHGAQRSIQMALVRYLADVRGDQKSDGARTLLLIDEPELYLHPQAVYRVKAALKDLSRGNYQVVFATHSPQMVDPGEIADTLIIRKSVEGETYALPTLREAVNETIEGAQSQVNTLFELGNASEILFSERVVLAEGKAEVRLLPVLVHTLTGSSLGESKTALVGIGSSYSIGKAIEVLDAVGIPVKAVTDLDYAFRAAVQAGLIEPENDNRVACRDLFDELAEEHGIELAEDGFPKKGGRIAAEDAFALLAEEERAAPHIERLRDNLLAKNVWVWSNGSIEHHLGITGKGEETWGEFVASLEANALEDVVEDPEGVVECLEWLTKT